MFLDGNPLDEKLARDRAQTAAYLTFLAQLRDADSLFAAVSAAQPAEQAAWQAAVYLLTGSRPAWRLFGDAVLATRSLTPVAAALDRASERGGGSERFVLAWAAHLWDLRREAPGFSPELGDFYFRRWINALHLRQGSCPSPASPNGA